MSITIEEIVADLRDHDPEIKRMAAKALTQIAPQPNDTVISVLGQADRPTAMVIYDVLFQTPGDFSPVFKWGMRDPDPEIRCHAIRYLFRHGMFSCEDGHQWLFDKDPYVRRRVISYLSWMNDRSSLPAILRLATEDPDARVRRDALRLIGVWGRKEDAGKVIAALEDSDTDVRTQAILTLKKITGEDFGNPAGATEDELVWIIAKWQGWWEITKEGK